MRERRTYGSVRGLWCKPLFYSTVEREILNENELYAKKNITWWKRKDGKIPEENLKHPGGKIMNYKEEIIRRKSEFVNQLRRNIVVGHDTIEQFAMGCFHDDKDGKWKIYANDERHNQCVYYELDQEDEAYEKFYEMILREVESIKYIEELKKKNK